jgi:hypothetical protein
LTSRDPEPSPPPRDLPGLAALAALGGTIALTVAAFVLLGIWADGRFGTSPLCLVLGLVLGCTAATAVTVTLARRYL